jgi:hemolysin activation/secretion protein
MLFKLTAFVSALSIGMASALAQPLPVPAVPNAVLAPPPVKKPVVVTPQIEDSVALPQADIATLEFRSVRIIGATKLAEGDLAAPFEKLANRKVSAAGLRGALDAVTRMYGRAGYALGRAFLPPQDLKDGVLTVRILEGYVGAIAIQTDTPRIKDTATCFAEHILASRPLRSADLERHLRLIAEIPGVTVTAKLTDMELASGKAVLILNLVYMPITTSLALNTESNLRDMPVQPYLTVRANNLTGHGDQFSFTSLLSHNPKDEYFLQGAASTLIGSDGLRLSSVTSVARTRANIQPRVLDLSSSQLRSELKLGYPVESSAKEQLGVAGGLYYSQLRYDLNHVSIAKDRTFAAFGDVTHVLQRSDKWSENIFARATLGAALPYPAGVPQSRNGAKRNFAKFNLSGAGVYAVTPRFSLLLRGDGQAASGSLMAGEETSYGGERFGRGYDSAVISGDHGFGLSVQPQYSFTIGNGWTSSFFAFGDYARAFNSRGDNQVDTALVSLGVGAGIARENYGITFGVGQPLTKVPFYTERLRPRLFVSLQIKPFQAVEELL